ncbi:cytochrome P450 [Favolaschia claudopus]|uniref:Cytochrome P450 n=1 Tax=Favolaschia claudopus TaxID=2862362 RepID=A0AAW0A819_9AGAR
MFLKLFGSIAGTLAAYALYKIAGIAYQELSFPLRHLTGPKANHKQLMRDMANGAILEEQWILQYGKTFKYPFFFGLSRIYTLDTKALNHIMTNHFIWQRPPYSIYFLSLIVGPGVLVTEGDRHRRQRKIMNPAFGPTQIKELTSIFLQKSAEVRTSFSVVNSSQMRDIWLSQSTTDSMRVDVLSWLNKTTLDIIGLAGFDCTFNSLNSSQPTELAAAFSATMRATSALSLFDIVRAWFPVFRFIPTKFTTMTGISQATMQRIGREIIGGTKAEMAENGGFGTGGGGRDLLSLLMRANTAKDVPESQRLSEEEVLAQVPTFLAAGHETTSTGTTWALFALSQNIPAQTRLRAELLALDTDTPTMDELNALPYLDWVVRESLRLNPPVVSTGRVATQDDVIPLDTPWVDKNGVSHTTLPVRKGQQVIIPIMPMNRDKSIWGADAAEFIPERWDSSISVPISNTIPGVWGQILTFLGGPRACIGYRFAIIEMKCLLFTLIRAFEFELAVPVDDIGRKISVVQHPMLKSEPEMGAQMPLVVKPYIVRA